MSPHKTTPRPDDRHSVRPGAAGAPAEASSGLERDAVHSPLTAGSHAPAPGGGSPEGAKPADVSRSAQSCRESQTGDVVPPRASSGPGLSRGASSNTPRNTPGGSRTSRETPRSAAVDTPPPQYATRLLGTPRLDYLTLAYKGEVAKAVRTMLNKRASDALTLRTCVDVDLGGVSLSLSTQSRDGWWTAENRDVRIQVDDRARGDWRLVVIPRASFLARVGPSGVREYARKLASGVLVAGIERAEPVGQSDAVVEEEERVRRVDLCADLLGLDVDSVADRTSWVCPRRAKSGDIGSMSRYGTARQIETLVIGKGDMRMRVYDKTEELKQAKNEGEKRDEEYERWRADGWDGEAPVTRVEYQVRGEALDEFRDPQTGSTFRSTDELFAKLDSLWRYCTEDWARLVDRSTDVRLDRCDTDPRWSVVQSARFGSVGKELERKRRRATSQARLIVSTSLNYGAITERLARVELPEPLKLADPVFGTRPERRREYEQRLLDFVQRETREIQALAVTAVADVIDDRMRERGIEDTARHLQAKRNAAVARHTSYVDDVRERCALEKAA